MRPDQEAHRRRPVLKAIGATSAIPFASGIVAADENGDEPTDDAGPPVIDPNFGYSGTADDEVPEPLTPDRTVGLHTDESRIDDSNLPEITVEFGAFHFEPLAIQVEPGAVVRFDFETPEHTVTAYHPDQERQRRVPGDVPAFSSTVNAVGGFWLYRFEAEGVYDVFCAPHEWGGMAMRIVVGDDPGDVVREEGRPPLPLTAALLGQGGQDLGPAAMAPQAIVDDGPVTLEDLSVDLSVTLTAPTPT